MKFKELAIEACNGYADKILKYVNLIEAKNKVMNLTGFYGERLWQEGIYESILSLSGFNIKGNLLDIGSGVGFPSIPFVIANPNIDLTIMEPKIKRISFLKDVSRELGMPIKFIVNRAEDYRDKQTFDFITARAVAPLYKLIELSFHLGHIGTRYIWIKGPNAISEIKDAKKIINKLNLNLNIRKINVGDKVISIITYVKNIETPKGVPRLWKDIVL